MSEEDQDFAGAIRHETTPVEAASRNIREQHMLVKHAFNIDRTLTEAQEQIKILDFGEWKTINNPTDLAHLLTIPRMDATFATPVRYPTGRRVRRSLLEEDYMHNCSMYRLISKKDRHKLSRFYRSNTLVTKPKDPISVFSGDLDFWMIAAMEYLKLWSHLEPGWGNGGGQKIHLSALRQAADDMIWFWGHLQIGSWMFPMPVADGEGIRWISPDETVMFVSSRNKHRFTSYSPIQALMRHTHTVTLDPESTARMMSASRKSQVVVSNAMDRIGSRPSKPF